MTPQLFVTMALNAWNLNIKRTTQKFDSFSDEQFFAEVAPGKNRLVYLLGHLTAVNDMMLPLLGLGERHYTQLDEAFINNPDRTVSELPSVQELRKHWTDINAVLAQAFENLQPGDWFKKHTLMSDEDFAKEPYRNRLSVLLTRTNHLSYHLGQIVLVKQEDSN